MLPLAIPVTDDAELHCSVSSLPKFHSVGVLVIQKFAVNIFLFGVGNIFLLHLDSSRSPYLTHFDDYFVFSQFYNLWPLNKPFGML